MFKFHWVKTDILFAINTTFISWFRFRTSFSRMSDGVKYRVAVVIKSPHFIIVHYIFLPMGQSLLFF